MANLSAGIGEIQVSCCPDDVIIALGLGSCVTIIVYDRPNGAVGMMHALLPTRKGLREAQDDRPGRYVDEGLHCMLNMMGVRSGHRGRLVGALVGGAAMFQFTGPSNLDIGTNNIEMSRQMLRHLNIPLVASEVGGTQSRSVTVTVADAAVRVRSIGSERLLTSLAAICGAVA